MINIDIDNLDDCDIRRLARRLHKQLDDKLFGDRLGVPDMDDHFYYNGIKACYLTYVGAPDYFITVTGNAYRELANGKIKKVKLIFNYGSWWLTTSTNCMVKRFSMHKLVAVCFVENPNGYKIVKFKDGDKANHLPYNLEWVDRTPLSHKKGAKMKPIEMYDLLGNHICDYGSLRECCEANHWNSSNISFVLHGKQSQAYGYVFKFKKQD